tara:strand:- start:1373 stop:2230 length:858 start_codon:yes stop_codon:yes gene_type:complete
MAATAITFNSTKFEKKLDVFAKKQLPFVAARTLEKLAIEARRHAVKNMYARFTYVGDRTAKSIVSKPAIDFTYGKQRGSVIFNLKKNQVIELYHRDDRDKGNAPSDYLRPIAGGNSGVVFRTKFQTRLQGKGVIGAGQYMMPVHGSPAAELGPTGRIKPAQYVKALWGIKAMEDVRLSGSGKYAKKGYKSLNTYRWVPTDVSLRSLEYAQKLRALNKGSGKAWKNSLPAAGIYKVTSQGLVQVFKTLDRMPRVPYKYKFRQIVFNAVNKNAERIFDNELNRVLKE